jgi:hypothetical protein
MRAAKRAALMGDTMRDGYIDLLKRGEIERVRDLLNADAVS